MLTFATVAAGKPSGMAPLTRHMLTQTVPREVADMGRYYTDYVRLMTHVDTVLPGRVHRVDHEALIADTEVEVRALLAA